MEVIQTSHTPAMLSGPSQKPLLTLAQKQALIDNLQLEITERARRLRAKYALDAQSLRSRLERRIRAIPHSLRTAKIGDLVEKYDAANAATAPASVPTREPLKTIGFGAKAERPLPSLPPSRASPSPQIRRMRAGKHGGEVVVSEDAEDAVPPPVHGAKRASVEISASDKENAYTDLSLPKKRVKAAGGPLLTSKALPPPPPPSKTTNAANSRATRTTSRKVTSKVLSPRSHNSRALPYSPSKPLLHHPTSRPGSPLKQFTAAITTTAAAAAAATATATATTKSKSIRTKTTTTATTARQRSTRVVTGHGSGNEKAAGAASTRTRTTTMAPPPSHTTGTITTASSARSRRGANVTTTGNSTATTATRANVRATAATTASSATISYPRVPSAASTASSTNSAGTTIVRSRGRTGAGGGNATTTANSKGVVGRVANAVAGRKAATAARIAKGAAATAGTKREAGTAGGGRVLRARK